MSLATPPDRPPVPAAISCDEGLAWYASTHPKVPTPGFTGRGDSGRGRVFTRRTNVAAGAAPDDPMAAFGANEWLVDEMYERYQQDPNSVDKAWWDFFKSYTPGDKASPSTSGGGNGTPQAKTQEPGPRKRSRPRRRSRSSPTRRPSLPRRRPRRSPSPPRPRRRRPKKTDTRPPTSQPRPDDPKATKAPAKSPVPKEPEPAATAEASDEPSSPPCAAPRRAPRRTWTSASPSRPPPASARCRSSCCGQPHRHQQPPRPRPRRQGVVHPPHRLRAGQGAASTMPEMNNGFDVVDGKPTLIQPGAHQPRPGHRPAQARRHPPAAGPVDQGRGDDGLRRVLDRLRGPRPQGPQQQARGRATSRAPRSA